MWSKKPIPVATSLLPPASRATNTRISVSRVCASCGGERLRPDAVVSMGGEDLVVYTVNAQGHIVNTYAGNKCASGTGEFLRQQLGRMDMRLEDMGVACEGASVYSLSARCSVFMKSDCTHRLNKGEATKGDIALSLSKAMADKVGWQKVLETAARLSQKS